MGKTYRNNNTRRFEDGGRRPKAFDPTSTKRQSGVKIIKQIYDQDDDYFDDDVDVRDDVVINRNSDKS